MITIVSHAKSVMLAGLIVIGIGVQCSQARADSTAVLTVAGGCFWCVESDFESVRGVSEVISGFTGGTIVDPTYKQVTQGGTGHYEAVQIFYNPDVVSRRALLTMFFRSVDPTDAGGQFCDRGVSYSTAIFVSNDEERLVAEDIRAKAQAALGQEIVTPILDAEPFYEADAYHQNYYKGTNLVFTRFGLKRQDRAYKSYREACGRDERVRQLWGDAAPFAGS